MLRPVEPGDLDHFFRQQRDPAASELAGVPMRERESFDERWRELLADADVHVRTIDADGEVAGYVFAFPLEGELRLGYWLGRDHWGRGLASLAVPEFLELEHRRPIHATVSAGNTASIRVLEKAGFAAEAGEPAPGTLRFVLRR